MFLKSKFWSLVILERKLTRIARFLIVIALVIFSGSVKAKDYVVGVSWANLESEETKATEETLKNALGVLGDRYIFKSANGSSAKQLEDVAELLNGGARVLIIEAVDPAKIRSALDLAKTHSIPIIAYRQIIDDPNVLNVALDYRKIGMLQAKEIATLRPGGNYVFAGGAANDATSGLIRDGQMEILAPDLTSGRVKNIAEFSSDGVLPDSAKKSMEEVLTANSSRVDAVLATDDRTAEGAIAALQREGLAGTVPVSGSGGSRAALDRILQGTQTVTYWQDPQKSANEMAQAADLLARGHFGSVPGARKEINSATGQEYFGVFIEPREFVKNNISDVSQTSGEDSPASPSKSSVRTVPIYFGTDRSDERGSSPPNFTAERSHHLTVGIAHVSIPDDHRFGMRERPSTMKLFWIKLTRKKVDPHQFFTVQDTKVLTESEFAKEASAEVKGAKRFGKRAFIFVHGFNVDFDDALYSVAQMVWDIQFDGLACLYSWPSKGSVTDYTYDSNSALQARDGLAEFLDVIQNIDGVESIDIIAHSMGSVALIEALRKHSEEANAKPFNQLIFAAPDIDKDNFISLAGKIGSYASGATLYASSNDWALNLSETLASGVPRAGDVPISGPMVVPNVDTIDASAVSNYLFGLNHSYFAQDRSVVADIGMLLERGARPPTARNSTIRALTNGAGQTYWQFPQ